MQILANFLDEKVPKIVGGINKPRLFDFTSNGIGAIVLFILGHQICDVARSQEIVDKHQELLLDDLAVGQNESNPNAFDAEELELLKALGAQAAMAIVNAKLYEQTVTLATSDALTGLDNRRSMEKRIEDEIARSQRFSKPLSLLMIDVDHFKDYNDRMGHVLGDAALKQMAQALRMQIRKVDGLARFGGEEFCAILPETAKGDAHEVAKKLRDLVNGVQLPGGSEQPLGFMSVSIGVAVYPDDMPAVIERTASTELVHAADEALYRAKAHGRNAVWAYGKERRES